MTSRQVCAPLPSAKHRTGTSKGAQVAAADGQTWSWSRRPRHGKATERRRSEAHGDTAPSTGPGPTAKGLLRWYLLIAVMVDEIGRPAPEAARRMTVCSCAATARVPASFVRMPQAGNPLGDIIDDPATPTATPKPGHPLGAGCAQPVQLPGPARPRPRGTHQGAVIANGSLYARRPPSRCSNRAPAIRRHAGKTAVTYQQTAELSPLQAWPGHPADDTDGEPPAGACCWPGDTAARPPD